MKRILVIGSGGSGKSTLSQRISKRLDIPVIHLDTYFWNANWVPKPNEEWDKIVEQFSNQDQWIMDGNYSRTMDIRIKKADLIIFLDMPRILCIYRIVKRRIMYRNKTRPDMNEGCPEKLDWSFIKWVWNYRSRSRPTIIQKLAQAESHQQVIILHTRKQVSECIERLAISSDCDH
ncbi:DNA topology modulation protein [Paenibacillus pini]